MYESKRFSKCNSLGVVQVAEEKLVQNETLVSTLTEKVAELEIRASLYKDQLPGVLFSHIFLTTEMVSFCFLTREHNVRITD